MKKLLLITVLMLSGCGSFNKEEIEICIKKCEPNDGIARLTQFGSPRECVCTNGAVFQLK